MKTELEKYTISEIFDACEKVEGRLNPKSSSGKEIDLAGLVINELIAKRSLCKKLAERNKKEICGSE